MILPWISHRWARLAFGVTKLIVVPVVFGFGVNKGLQLAPDLAASLSISHLLLAALVYQVAVLANSSRLCVLIKTFGGSLSLKSAQRINLLAHLYFFVLMTGVAVEAVRILSIRKYNSGLSGSEIAAVILLDKFAGAVTSATIVAFGTGSLVSQFHEAWQPTVLVFLTMLTLPAAVAIGAFVPKIRRHALRTWQLLVRSPFSVLAAILQSAMGSILMAFGAWIVTQNMLMTVGFNQILWALMAGQVLMLIPFSLLGLGPAELGTVALLTTAGASPTEGLVVAFLAYFMRASAALVGMAIGLWEDGASLLNTAAR